MRSRSSGPRPPRSTAGGDWSWCWRCTRLAGARASAAPPDDRGDPRTLSAREREVVRLVAHGHTGPEIADELGIAHDTVRSHVRNAMDKLGARSRAHLVAKTMAAELTTDEAVTPFTPTG